MSDKIKDIANYVKSQIQGKDVALFVAMLDEYYDDITITEKIANHMLAVIDENKHHFDIKLNPKKCM